MRQRTRWGGIFHVTEEQEDIVDAVLTKGRSLSGADRLLFESSDYQVSGNTILERHENLSPDGVPESIRLDNLLLRFPDIPKDQLFHYKHLLLETELTYPVAVRLLHRTVRRDGIEPTLSWLESVADAFVQDCSADPDVLDVQREQLEEELGMPTYGYHKVGEMFESDTPEVEWLDRQPHLVQRLITTPERCNSLSQLKLLGKRCYEADAQTPGKLANYQQVYVSMSNAQRAVFWGYYHIRKSQLQPRKPATPTALALMQRIENADGKSLRRFKATLYKMQHGQIRLRELPADYEWNTLWSKVREMEYAMDGNEPEEAQPPDGYSRCGYCYVSGGEMYRPVEGTSLPTARYESSRNVCHCLDCRYF